MSNLFSKICALGVRGLIAVAVWLARLGKFSFTVRLGLVVKHFRGGEYHVISEAVHSETNERVVVYASASAGCVFVRPVRMFWESVLLDDGTLRRRFAVQSPRRELVILDRCESRENLQHV